MPRLLELLYDGEDGDGEPQLRSASGYMGGKTDVYVRDLYSHIMNWVDDGLQEEIERCLSVLRMP